MSSCPRTRKVVDEQAALQKLAEARRKRAGAAESYEECYMCVFALVCVCVCVCVHPFSPLW